MAEFLTQDIGEPTLQQLANTTWPVTVSMCQWVTAVLYRCDYAAGLVKGTRHFYALEHFDLVANLNVVVVLYTNTALGT